MYYSLIYQWTAEFYDHHERLIKVIIVLLLLLLLAAMVYTYKFLQCIRVRYAVICIGFTLFGVVHLLLGFPHHLIPNLKFYKVTGPSTIRPNSEYHVSIGIHGTLVPTIVNVSLAGIAFTGRSYYTHEVITIQPYTSRITRLEVGDIEPGEYRLSVRGSGGLQFSKSTPLKYVRKSYTVLIQTDKAVYKPGHKVLLRTVVLNSQLKPAAEVRNEPLNIHVSDGDGNKVKEWRNIIATKGVFTDALQLSKNPVLGKWNISVTIHRQTFNKTIEVAQYIVPKFLINIQTPEHITFKQNILIAHIQALYDYGKKVKGDATVTVYPTIFSGVIQPIFQNPLRKVVPVDGSATVEFDIANELKLSDEYERTVIVDVTIEEALTSRRQNNSIEVHLHKYDYKMELIKTAEYYKPGLVYVAYVKVTNHDGTLILPDKKTVTIRYGYSRQNEVYKEEKFQLDDNGLIKLELLPPSDPGNKTALRIEAEYLDLKERMSPVPAAVSPSNTFLQATLVTNKPIVNTIVEILVTCTEPMLYINYELLGRGDVVLSHTFQIEHAKEFRFRFTATHAMVPVSHLIINYVRSDGELVADSLDIEISHILQNFLDVQINTAETQPDTEIDIVVQSQPNSYIALLAVDQAVSRLRPGYDITQAQVSDELWSYDNALPSPYWSIMKDAESHFFWRPGSSNSRDVYSDSGAVILTNTIVVRERPTLEDIYIRPVSYGSSTVKPDRGVGLALHTVTRPPLAGPYAFSRIPRPVWDKPKVYLTQEIADTWLFTNFSSGFEGSTTIRRRIPNTLNTWSITGFSLDPLFGLGLISSPKKLKVSKPFVVTLDLPHSIQREETIAIPVVVYNHMKLDTIAEITLHNPEQKFIFTDVTMQTNGTKKIELYRRKKVVVRGNSAASVSFMVTLKKIGRIEVRASASTTSVQDSITEHLLVVAGGETQYYTKTILIDLRKQQQQSANVTIEIPKNIVSGSESIDVSVVGDLLGPAILNLESLIRLPSGCGEQNLVHFMPDLIVLNYLERTSRLVGKRNEAIDNLEVSYQQQLTYRRPDGSFSAFGKSDVNGSVWITSYVAFAFHQAKPYIYVDDNIISTALDWLANNQQANGSFYEVGSIVHHEMQNRNGDSLALTAFVITAFIENQRRTAAYDNVINKGVDYIARNIDENESVYTIAVCAYTLQLARHISKKNAFNLLDSKAQVNNSMKWWAKPIPKGSESNPWNSLPKSIDIETTSYGLLAFLEAGLLDDAVPVLNWLVNQGNNFGGFTSSHDTVMGLTALYNLVARLGVQPGMQVEYAYRPQEVERFSINQDNAIIEQKRRISSDARTINMTAQGRGFALFRVSYLYNMNVTGPWPLFTLDPQVDKNSNSHHLQLSVCTAFVKRNLSETADSNMAIMEVNFPSGFTADIDSLPSLEVSQNVRRVETKNDHTTVVLYFNNLTMTEFCPTVSAFRTHKVAGQKPAAVIVYDYYDSSRRARIFYKVRPITLCDICEEDDCGKVCDSTSADPQKSSEGGGAVGVRVDWLCVTVVFVVLLVVEWR